MKRLIGVLMVLAVCSAAFAQTTPTTTATWNWGAVTQYTNGATIPATTPVTYNLYEGVGAGNEAATPVQTGITALTVVTSGHVAGTTVCGYVTAVAGGVEGGHSNEACKSFPGIPKATSLTVQ